MKRLLTAVAVLLPAWSAASAQDNKTYRDSVGVGAQLRPAYVGADDDDVRPLFRFDIARGTNPSASSRPTTCSGSA